MTDINCIVISGRLVADPTMRATAKGTKVAAFRIASDRFFADKKEVVFIDVSTFSRTAENIEKYLHKGDPVLVRGKIELNEWKAKDGSARKTYRILGDEVVFLPRHGGKRREGAEDDPLALPPGLEPNRGLDDEEGGAMDSF